jgi:hypothetical protein
MTYEKLRVWLTIFKNLTLNVNHLKNYAESIFLSDRETLLFLKERQIGISRFGDGELSYLSGYSFPHQKQDPILRKKLITILTTYHQDTPFLVALPYEICINQHQKRNLPRKNWNSAKYSLLPYVKEKQTYGSPFCFRMLSVIDDDKHAYAELLINLFKEKDIIYVGGVEPYPGLIQVRRFIKSKQVHAFDEYEQLMENILITVRELKKPCVILSCGITATALSVDLNHKGVLSYDVGLCFTRRLSPFVDSPLKEPL